MIRQNGALGLRVPCSWGRRGRAPERARRGTRQKGRHKLSHRCAYRRWAASAHAIPHLARRGNIPGCLFFPLPRAAGVEICEARRALRGRAMRHSQVSLNHDVVPTSRFSIFEFLCAYYSSCPIGAAVAGHLDLLRMYLVEGPNRARGRPTDGRRYPSSTPVARCSDGGERGQERG